MRSPLSISRVLRVHAQLIILALSAFPAAAQPFNTNNPPVPLYQSRRIHDPDGIGKFYLGREIAAFMGHQGADWLERPEREQEEQPTKMLEQLKIKSGDVVADIGAGTGYMSRRLAVKVGPK